MSFRQMHSNHRQPRPFLVPSQTPLSRAPAHHNLYRNSTASRHTAQVPNRQPAADAGIRFPFNMPNFSAMTNSALIDALLTPSNEQEQEREHRAFSLSAPLQDTRVPVKHALSSAGPVDDLFELSDRDQSIETRKQPGEAGERKPRKQQKRKSAVSAEADDDYFVEAPFSDDSNSQHHRKKPRRSNRSKKSSVPVDPPTPEDDYFPPQKEQKLKKSNVATKPRKARTGRLIRKKPVGTAVPKTLNEAGPADRMMWEWKNQGKNWEEIRAEWKRLTGVEPGGSSLSVRYIKLVENLARNGAAGDIELLKFKREAEEELMSQLWSKVAEKMLAFSPDSEHNPKDLQKRYNMIVRSGYDVEQLIADDNIKHENDSKQTSHLSKTNEHPNEFHMDLNAIASYNNPVANETLARLREQEASVSDVRISQSQYTEDLPAMPEDDHADIFTGSRVLNQQVDGLNELTHLDTSDYRILGDHDTRYLIPSETHVRRSPFTAQKNKFRQQVGTPYLAATSSLVDYGSDSE